MPPALKPYWGKINYIPKCRKNTKQMQGDLAKQLKKQEDQIKALFACADPDLDHGLAFRLTKTFPRIFYFIYSTPICSAAIQGNNSAPLRSRVLHVLWRLGFFTEASRRRQAFVRKIKSEIVATQS